MTPLILFFMVPATFLLVCWVLYRLNHPPQGIKVEPLPQMTQAASDAISVLRNLGYGKRNATVVVERIVILSPNATTEEIVRTAFEQRGKTH